VSWLYLSIAKDVDRVPRLDRHPRPIPRQRSSSRRLPRSSGTWCRATWTLLNTPGA
jgi:hypothetical protein